ncbi:MAG: hypothetical protein ABI682_00150 [Acidobacteriota bacterium]
MGQLSSSNNGAVALSWRRVAPGLFAVLFLAVLSHGVLSLLRASRERRAGFAGAHWIWFSSSPERQPARFTALSAISLTAVPRLAVARVFVDRRYELSINGVRAALGGQRPGDPARAVDVTSLLRAGRNSVAILAESPEGIGGILFALDLGGGAPALVSGPGWTIDPDGRRLDPPGREKAALLGRPPLHPWGWRALTTERAGSSRAPTDSRSPFTPGAVREREKGRP